MKKLIVDSCTIILLAKASVLETASESYILLITQEVYKEVLEGKTKQFKDALLTERLKETNKIKIVKPDTILMNKLMKDFNMGEGEASTVAIAIKDKNTITATDNKQGRNATKINNMPLVGSPDIIVALCKQKKINIYKATAALKIIQEKGWFDTYLIEKSLEDLK